MQPPLKLSCKTQADPHTGLYQALATWDVTGLTQEVIDLIQYSITVSIYNSKKIVVVPNLDGGTAQPLRVRTTLLSEIHLRV